MTSAANLIDMTEPDPSDGSAPPTSLVAIFPSRLVGHFRKNPSYPPTVLGKSHTL
jgi:hypothetical protein